MDFLPEFLNPQPLQMLGEMTWDAFVQPVAGVETPAKIEAAHTLLAKMSIDYPVQSFMANIDHDHILEPAIELGFARITDDLKITVLDLDKLRAITRAKKFDETTKEGYETSQLVRTLLTAHANKQRQQT